MQILIQSAHRSPSKEYRVLHPATRIAKVEGYEDLLPQFAEYIAEVYRTEIIRAVKTQRFHYKWSPLSEGYLSYKVAHGLSPNIWEASGLLINSIKVFKVGSDSYLVGIDKKVKYSNGTSVLFVARCMEYGTSRMPARPLFRPISSYISKNIRRYWNKFLEEVS